MSNSTAVSGKASVITEVDYDRLSHLLGSPTYRANQPAALTILKGELERRQVVAAQRVPKGVVTMHTVVQVTDLEDDESETYTLVYPEEASINEGKLSVLAPMGTALLGARAGQVVKFNAPGGTRRLKVARIVYQPEAAGDFHL